MRNALILSALLAAFSVAAAVSAVVAAEDEAKAPEEAVSVVITGENYCLLQALAPEEMEGANAAYAKMNALKVTQAEDALGMMLTELEGKTLHYLPNKIGQALLVNADTVGKTVKVTGNLFQNAAAIQVTGYEVVEAKSEFSWDEPAVGTRSTKKLF